MRFTFIFLSICFLEDEKSFASSVIENELFFSSSRSRVKKEGRTSPLFFEENEEFRKFLYFFSAPVKRKRFEKDQKGKACENDPPYETLPLKICKTSPCFTRKEAKRLKRRRVLFVQELQKGKQEEVVENLMNESSVVVSQKEREKGKSVQEECSYIKKRSALDVGSKGIRLGVFGVDSEKGTVVQTFFNDRKHVSLMLSIHNGKLPPEVLDESIRAIGSLLSEAIINPKEEGSIFAFATAWARSINNRDHVIGEIKKRTGVTLNVIEQKTEGEIGFQAILVGLRSSALDSQSFLHQTDEGKEIFKKLLRGPENTHIESTLITTWDIGGGSMQFSQQDENRCIKVIGSDDSSTLFANSVLTNVKKQGFHNNTPNPLSMDEIKLSVDLAVNRAKQLFSGELPQKIQPEDGVTFGIGTLHESNRRYINTLLNIKRDNFYQRSDLERASNLLADKNDEEIAATLGFKESEARNRLTSMLLVLGFMEYLGLERVYTMNFASITGALFEYQYP